MMHIRHALDDFRVEEHIHFPGQQGNYNYYQVEKRNASMAGVREAMAECLGVTPSAVTFPAPRDIAPVVVHYASVRKRGPQMFEGQGFVARHMQQGPRALKAKDLEGNRFNIIVRHLSKTESQQLGDILQALSARGLPNYFDEQRFASLTRTGFVGKALLKNNAQEAVRMYIAEPMGNDSEEVLKFKAQIQSHWGQWGYLLHKAPRPSNLRSVVTYLKDHPHDYEEAVNRIQDQLLNFFMLAYQSWLWNGIVAGYIKQKRSDLLSIEIADSEFPLPYSTKITKTLQKMVIDLPRLTAYYPPELNKIAEAVFAEEDIAPSDFSIRLLRRVCLTKSSRPVWFAPTDLEVGKPFVDEYAPEYWAVPVHFTLPLGHYATVVLKAAAAHLETTVKT